MQTVASAIAPVSGHPLAMAEAGRTDLVHESALATAKALALTACDLLTASELLNAAREEFAARAKV